MSELRGIRLLNAVENGTVLGAELETYLSDAGRLAEFTVLLSQRGQTVRMANAQTTMSAITLSARANTAVFVQATDNNSAAVRAVVSSSIAMSTVSVIRSSLISVSDNPTSWGYFSTSPYYEINIRNIVANYANLDPLLYPNISSLILNVVSMGDISVNSRAMRAVVASQPTVTIMVGDSAAMALVASDTTAITTVASTTAIMPTVANSTVAMAEIIARSGATLIVSSNVGSIQAIAANLNAWVNFRNGTFFIANLKTIISNLIGINPLDYVDIDSIIADPIALGSLALSQPAVQALIVSPAAMATLAISPNIGVILSSPTAMALIGPNNAAMISFLDSSLAWGGLFSSSVAKGYIVASTGLVDSIASNSGLLTYLGTISVNNVAATGLPDGNATSLQPFNAATPLPTKLLTLSAKEVGIAATFSNYNFGGSAIAGTQAGVTLSLSGTGNGGQPVHIAAYTNMTWNFQGVGVTAATLPIITYVDMT
tara:strand:+ start:76 stop:1533 length:1458 start_codon:yes stop_codon:yes gene_type:complete